MADMSVDKDQLINNLQQNNYELNTRVNAQTSHIGELNAGIVNLRTSNLMLENHVQILQADIERLTKSAKALSDALSAKVAQDKKLSENDAV